MNEQKDRTDKLLLDDRKLGDKVDNRTLNVEMSTEAEAKVVFLQSQNKMLTTNCHAMKKKLAEAKQKNEDVQNWLKLEEGNSDFHSDARVKMQQLAKTKKEEKSKCEDILNCQKKEIQ